MVFLLLVMVSLNGNVVYTPVDSKEECLKFKQIIIENNKNFYNTKEVYCVTASEKERF